MKGADCLELVGYLLTGAAAAAVIKLIDNLIIWWLNRHASKADKSDALKQKSYDDEKEWKKRTDEMIDNLTVGVRVILMDRILYLGQRYIQDGEVDFDDRRLLHEMHNVYHTKLGGNGDLDALMDGVNNLPLKKK